MQFIPGGCLYISVLNFDPFFIVSRDAWSVRYDVRGWIKILSLPVTNFSEHPFQKVQMQLLDRNVQRFRGGSCLWLIDFMYQSTLGFRVIKKKKKNALCQCAFREDACSIEVWGGCFFWTRYPCIVVLRIHAGMVFSNAGFQHCWGMMSLMVSALTSNYADNPQGK